MEWKPRGAEEDKPYKARQITHEANTSLEYGEKTWTTAQTVRDLMQNHLDAETDRFYKNLSSVIFDNKELENLNQKGNESFKKNVENFIYSSYMFVTHVEDMTPETRVVSEMHLNILSEGLPIKTEFIDHGVFQTSVFLEQARSLGEHLPLVSYDVIDAKTGKSIGLIPYETLRDEELYQEKQNNQFRFLINGIKIVDHGSGYDSHLSSLYISSKTGKKYLRGKYGEGAKMSELHLLRHNAQIKMRSQYGLVNSEGKEINRLWQTKPKVKDGRLVSEGVEIEKPEEGGTGSMVYIILNKNTDEVFKEELIANIDPRTGGLSANIAEFKQENFVYPMPISEEVLVGIDIKGSGEVQYIQGLRVELAADSFGYSKPWFSYDVLDSSIIAGRDRNEIKEGLVDRIETFWNHNDNPELLKTLVHTLVHDKSKSDGNPPELSFLEGILVKDQRENEHVARVQKIIDQELLTELSLEEGVETFIVSKSQLETDGNKKAIQYAYDKNYKFAISSKTLNSSSVDAFAHRISKNFKVLSLGSIFNEMNELKEKNDILNKEFVEGEREFKIREVFAAAVRSVNSFLDKAGIKPKEIDLDFQISSKSFFDEYDLDEDFGSYGYGSSSTDDEDSVPIQIGFDKLIINPDEVSDPRHSDSYELQQKIEIYLLSMYNQDNFSDFEYDTEEFEQNEETLKMSQQFLDSMITKFIPEDSPLLKTIPDSFDYTKNSAFVGRLLEAFFNNNEAKRETEEQKYITYRKILSPELNIKEAKNLLQDNTDYTTKNIITNRVFFEDNVLQYYNEDAKRWEKQSIDKSKKVSMWNNLPVYELNDGRVFIPASMGEGAVLAKGQGKKREYIFNEGSEYLEIGKYGVSFSEYNNRDISVNKEGFIFGKNRNSGDNLSIDEYIQKQLQEYHYYPMGTKESRSNKIVEGVVATAIPIEYGQDEWDNPIRIFQDIIQNHIDASVGKEIVKLTYEINREGQRMWVQENDINSTDIITGLSVSDNGEGYSPSEIGTMGASSKKSPLFAGKYGEGQKMVAAAALRSGLDLEYSSFVQKEGENAIIWKARAVAQNKNIVLGGEEIEKKLVAFDVEVSDDQKKVGSHTTLKLSEKALPEEIEQWDKWMSIIDPRQKDEKGNPGMARFIRQIRKPDIGREYKVGSITLLLDEPGAVYENGLRINASAEKGRALAFGYDVPEIVTTRERNSYNHERLEYYIQHIFSHITDTSVIKEILQKITDGKTRGGDLRVLTFSGKNALPVWEKVAQEIWPDFFVHSNEYFSPSHEDDDFFGDMNESDRKRRIEEDNNKARIQANIKHLDRKKILFVSKKNYPGFQRMLPSAESAINQLETEKIPISEDIKKILSSIVAESTKVFSEIHTEAKDSLTSEQAYHHPLLHSYKFDEKVSKWGDSESIMSNPNGVGVAPITSGFHGRVDQSGVVFNEALLLGKDTKRDLAETALHEIAHLLSGADDYTEKFVALLYELAKYFIKQKSNTN